jgi:hypothetical protein
MGNMSEKKLIRNTEKVYPSHSRLLVYKHPFMVQLGSKVSTKNKKKMTDIQKNQLIERSLRRTKEVIRDIILCNTFEYFCTFTFKDHRDDVDICKARMQYWLHSQQKLHGSFQYLIVPEFHKDGKALHFHALFQGYKGRMRLAVNPHTDKAIITSKNKLVFRFPGWAVGFSDAIEITQEAEDRAKVASYVTKYITKDMPQFHGKKRYWVSQGLVRPEKSNNVDQLPYYSQDVDVKDSDDFTIYVRKAKGLL